MRLCMPVACARAITIESGQRGQPTTLPIPAVHSKLVSGVRSISVRLANVGPGNPKALSKATDTYRVAWFLTHGKLPDIKGYHGAVVRHKCHNRLCCNPDHLEIGTQADNVNDMWTREGGPKGNTRLTDKQIAEIRSDPRSSRQLAPLYGVSDAHIRSIRQGRTWKGKSK
jgi:hypothetical protein